MIPAGSSQNEIDRRRCVRQIQSREADHQIGIAVAVDVPFHEPPGPVPNDSQLTCGRERILTNERERVAGTSCDRVDRGQVDAVTRFELDDQVARSGTGVRRRRVNEGVAAELAAQRVRARR